MMSQNYIVRRSIKILDKARANIIERDKSYNGNGISFEDYRINGLESCIEEVAENIIRLWNSNSDDKAEDCCAYMSLMCAFIQEGMPQSKFSPIFRRFIPELMKAIKIDDTKTGELIDANYSAPQPRGL